MRKVFVIFKWLLAIFLLVVLLVVLNDKRLISQQIIKVSHKSGFYLKPFKLSLPTDNKHTIRYTLDGSNPTNKSEIFKTPLLITGNESYDSLSFINTTIADSIANFGWRAPIGEQDKATIVKYAGFQNGSLQTEIKTLSFFIDYGLDKIIMQTKYQLPIISISTDKRNLYSKDKGLFIAGDNFKTNKINSGNYFERGMDFEREVYFQYFNDKGKLDFGLEIGMRIHGGITRRNPQKSLKFYARKEYGETEVSFPFLAKQGVNRFILESMQESGGGQALIEDIVAQEIVKGIGLEQQNSQAVIVFINGEYWGLHTIRDRIDENYLAYKFNLHKDSFDIIDGNPSIAYEIINGNNSDYLDLLAFIKETDLSITKNYNYTISKLDIDNFIDYYSVEIFFANHDWPIHNAKLWKKKNKGKWRWILYDLDGGFTNKRDHLFNMFERISIEGKYPYPEATLLFRNLIKNQSFRDQFIARYKEILKLYMQPERTIPIVDSISNIYRINIQSHVNRWRYPWTVNHWERDLNKNIKDFLRNREKSTIENLNNIMKHENL